ncbi:MAG: ABC transporter substrate-binding protein [Magnetococcales bacterium]|nr:ABC transporter substrate-binding protein [Magnetococcales bacterium]
MKKTFFVAFFALLLLWSPSLWAAHGISLDGDLKYPKGFSGFEYTSERAKVGGKVTLYSLGGFDKMNPFTLKGVAPDHLGSLLFDTLMVQSLDEPFAQYGLLATDIHVAEDGLSVACTLDPDARFSDGSPLTAEDVKYSLEVLQSEAAHPFYAGYFRDIKQAEVVGPHQIIFHFAQQNRELPLIFGEMPIFSRAFFAKHSFEGLNLTIPLGSGPYTVESMVPGKTITFKRNPNYWGWKRAVNRGMYNFERIEIKYFKDSVVALEGFKAGEFDFLVEHNSKHWARDYQGDKFDEGLIKKEQLIHKRGAGMQGFVFNLRREKFQDKRVREALTLAFDFEWSNKNLFHGQYVRSDSFFSNSEMAAKGKPSPAELALLEPFRDQLDPAVFEAVKPPPSTLPPGSIRHNLRRAMKLLKEAGWKVGKDRILRNSRGTPLQIDMMLASASFERIIAPYVANLKRLGVAVNYRTVDLALYKRRLDTFDFDMIVTVFGQSQSPGNEQRDMWHSASADAKGSKNYIGIKDPVVDALVDAIIYSTSRSELLAACRALDRVLLAGHYLVPNWYLNTHRIAYWNKFDRPTKLPLYYSADSWLWSWWIKEGSQ